jgi:pimeloyl-ACP methyl ester carboxylesterase
MSGPVRFRGAGEVWLEGRVFGSGDVGVVLGHMRPGDQSQWFGFAALLADRGYLVLTYDRRGVCPGGELGCSGGRASDSGWEDLAYAVDLLRERGASRVVVGGASLGAMESMYALSQGLDADGLIWLSGVDLYAGVPVTELVRAVHVPKLLAAGEFDGDAVALPAVERVAPPPTEVVVLDTGEHGTDILEFGDPAAADEFRRSVFDFLAGI